MMRRRAALTGALVLLVVAGLVWRLAVQYSDKADNPRVMRREFLAMGTRISVTIYRRDNRTPQQADAALTGIERYMRDFGRQWWAWGDGELGSINRQLAAGGTVDIPPPMQPLFARAAAISRSSGGLFEPRIGSLVRLWGFDDVARLRERPPAPGDIDAAVAALHAAPVYNGSGSYGPAPGITWDFGAVAKGYAVDQALAQLHSAGFDDAIVDAGGNLAVRGEKGDQPWHIAIRQPRPVAGSPFLATIAAHDEAVNTHGDYERHFEYQGRSYGHILDPASGYPAESLISVTVVAADGTLADGGGAALFVAGAERWRDLARTLGLDEVVVVDAQGHVSVTSRLAPRLELATGISASVVN